MNRLSRLKFSVWALVTIWFLATYIAYLLLLSQNSFLWYVIDAVGVVSGIWVGVKYFRWSARSTSSSAKLFVVTIISFLLFVFIFIYILGIAGFNLISLCSSSQKGALGCSSTSLFLGFDFSILSFISPLDVCIFIAWLYCLYRFSHTFFIR
jgi:hypothetical protein